MRDDGINGDAIAGDGIFSTTLRQYETHRRLIRYRITVADTLGVSVRVPYADDEQPNFAYFVYNGVPAWSGTVQSGATGARGELKTFPSTLLENLQTWHLIANSSDVTNSQYSSSFNGVRFLGTIAMRGTFTIISPFEIEASDPPMLPAKTSGRWPSTARGISG